MRLVEIKIWFMMRRPMIQLFPIHLLKLILVGKQQNRKIRHLLRQMVILRYVYNFLFYICCAYSNLLITFRYFNHRFLPSKPAAEAITKVIQSKYDHPWPSWGKIPRKTRGMWFKEFQARISYFIICLLMFLCFMKV